MLRIAAAAIIAVVFTLLGASAARQFTAVEPGPELITGDQGKYVANGGIAVNQLMSTYERTLTAPTATSGALDDGTLTPPESQNGVPDILDEARWELEWMLQGAGARGRGTRRLGSAQDAIRRQRQRWAVY